MSEVNVKVCCIEIGCVVSDKMNKIVIVLVECCVKYLVIGKVMIKLKKYYVYVEGLEVGEGDFV